MESYRNDPVFMAVWVWVLDLANELDRLAFTFTANQVREMAEENGIILPPTFKTAGHRYCNESEPLSPSDMGLCEALVDEFDRLGFASAARQLRAGMAGRVRDPDHVLWSRAARRAAGLRTR